jgi:hypothetical protein
MLVRLTWSSAAKETKVGTKSGPREPVAQEPKMIVVNKSSFRKRLHVCGSVEDTEGPSSSWSFSENIMIEG